MEENPKQNSKICSRCKEEKNISLFSKNKNMIDGLQKECKDCKNKYTLENKHKRKLYNQNNKEYISKYVR